MPPDVPAGPTIPTDESDNLVCAQGLDVGEEIGLFRKVSPEASGLDD